MKILVRENHFPQVGLDSIEGYLGDRNIQAVVTRINPQVKNRRHCFRVVFQDMPRTWTRLQVEFFRAGIQTRMWEPVEGDAHPVRKRWRMTMFFDQEPEAEKLRELVAQFL